jgi:taurine dioxygenase
MPLRVIPLSRRPAAGSGGERPDGAGAELGAEIDGVDLRDPVDEETFAELREAWLRYGVLLFRDQQLAVNDQTRFAERFGALQHVRTVADAHEHPAVMMVSNVEIEGAKAILPHGPMQFHSDQCYYERPASATLLYALEIPPRGGDTLFADCRAAYEQLPEEVQRRIDSLRARFVYDYGSNATEQSRTSDPHAPRYEHPVVRTHPVTGRKAIFVNRLMTEALPGVDAGEERELLERLYTAIERPENRYRHVWRTGDLLIWDNRCVQHARTDFDGRQRRVLRRVTVQGDRPY